MFCEYIQQRHFLVKVTNRTGEFESTSKVLVESDTEAQAKTVAIESQAHDELEWDNGTATECSGEATYRVQSCTLVEPKDVAALKKYL